MGFVAIGLGSNLGDRRQNLTNAIVALARRVGDIIALSSLYENEPVGFESENNFLNAALILRTDMPAMELLDTTRLIEIEMGRVEKSDGAYHDRIIDIDLLMVNDSVCDTPRLTLPHPRMHLRRFVMEPLAEIAPDLRHPVLGKRMDELRDKLVAGRAGMDENDKKNR